MPDIPSEINDLLQDPEVASILRSAYEILEYMNTLKGSASLQDITMRFYREDPQLISDEGKIALRRKRAVVSRLVGNLREYGFVIENKDSPKKDRRMKYYSLTTYAYSLLGSAEAYETIMRQGSTEKKINKNMIPVARFYREQYHSNRVRELLKRMKQELSEILDLTFQPAELNYKVMKIRVGSIRFKADPLYQDLSHHIKAEMRFSDLERLIYDYLNAVVLFVDHRDLFRTNLSTEISRHLSLSFSINLSRENSFNEGLLDIIVTGLDMLERKPPEDKVGNTYHPNHFYDSYSKGFLIEAEKIVPDGVDRIMVRIDGSGVIMLGIHYKEHVIKEKLEAFMEGLKTSEIRNQYREVEWNRMKVYELRQRIMDTLDKEIDVPLYPGSCKFITGRKNAKSSTKIEPAKTPNTP